MRTTATLTPAGSAWATANREASLVARVALTGGLGKGLPWPAQHVAVAVAICNREGEAERAA